MSSKTRLTVRQHYHCLLDLLKRYAHLWWSIGLELKFYPNELKVIQSNPLFLTHPNPTVGYLGEILELWLLWAPGDGRGSRNFATFEDIHAALLRVDGIPVEVLDGLHLVLDQPPDEPLPPVVHSTPQSPLDAATLPQPSTDGPVAHQHIQSSLAATAEQPMEDSSNNKYDVNVNSSITNDEKSVFNLESITSPSNDQPCDVDCVQSVLIEQSHEASLQDKLDKLEHEYRMITFNFDKLVQSVNVALDDLQSYAASLPIRVQKCYEELNTDTFQSKTENAKNTRQFVAILNKFSTFMNPALLGDAIKMFGDEKTKSEMNAYNSKLQEFQASTKLEDFVKVAWEGVTPKGYEQIELELEENWREKTLKDISPPKRSWLLKKLFEGSLKIIFSIPDLKDLKEEVVQEFLKKHVKRVLIKGQCILNFEIEESHNQTAPEESESVKETFISPAEVAFRFSSFSHGKNVIVSEDGLEVCRRDVRDRGGGGVYIPTPLSGRVEFEIEVTDCDRKIRYSLAIGIAQTPRESYKHLDISLFIRDYYCYWGGKELTSNLSGLRVKSSFGSVSLHDVERGDRVGLQVTSEGHLSFTFNGITQGVAARSIYREDRDTYLYVNVDGSTTALRITRAVISGYQPPAEGHKGQVDQLATPTEGSVSPNPIEFKFHPVTGKNIMLLKDGLVARRVNPSINLYGAVVYGSVPIKHRGTLEVEIVEFGNAWLVGSVDSIVIGVMRIPTGTELKESDIPEVSTSGKNHCVWLRYEVWNRLDGHYFTRSNYSSVDLIDLRPGDKVGMRLSSYGTLSFFVNGRSQGVAVRGLNEDGYDIYPVVDVRSKCCAVRITRAETHSEVLDLQELCIEKIASCLDWSSKDVNLLPLPQRLKNQIEHYIHFL